MARKAVRLVPDNPSPLDTHAWVLYRSSMYKEAVQVIEDALRVGGVQNSCGGRYWTMVISCISWTERPAAIGRKHRKKALKNEKLLRKIRDENSMNKLLFGAWFLFASLVFGQIHLRAHSKTSARKSLYTSMQPNWCSVKRCADARVNMDDDGVQSMLADITMQTDSSIGAYPCGAG